MYKQLLMVSGFERYYQIVKCFRDEDLRADRQMEFTQIDVEMSFVDEEDIYNLIEKMIQKMMKEVKGIDVKLPFPRYKYEESMDIFGSDKPDTRFDLKLVNISDIFKDTEFSVFKEILEQGGVIKAITAKQAASKYSRKEIDRLTNEVKKYKAKGLAWLKYDNNEFSGSIAKFVTEDIKDALIKKLNVENNDIIFIISDQAK